MTTSGSGWGVTMTGRYARFKAGAPPAGSGGDDSDSSDSNDYSDSGGVPADLYTGAPSDDSDSSSDESDDGSPGGSTPPMGDIGGVENGDDGSPGGSTPPMGDIGGVENGSDGSSSGDSDGGSALSGGDDSNSSISDDSNDSDGVPRDLYTGAPSDDSGPSDDSSGGDEDISGQRGEEIEGPGGAAPPAQGLESRDDRLGEQADQLEDDFEQQTGLPEDQIQVVREERDGDEVIVARPTREGRENPQFQLLAAEQAARERADGEIESVNVVQETDDGFRAEVTTESGETETTLFAFDDEARRELQNQSSESTTSPSPQSEFVGRPGRPDTDSASERGSDQTASNVTEAYNSGRDLGEIAADDPVDAVMGFGEEAREWQRETTPVQDAGDRTREALSQLINVDIPTEEEAAEEANRRIANLFNSQTPREQRLQARGEIIDTTEDTTEAAAEITGQAGSDTARRTQQANNDPLSGRNTAILVGAAALAEPTPIGEAIVLGGAAGVGAGAATASGTTQGDERVPDSPISNREVEKPDEPAGSNSELDAPQSEDEIGSQSEVTVPEGQRRVSPSELGLPDDTFERAQQSEQEVEINGPGRITDDGDIAVPIEATQVAAGTRLEDEEEEEEAEDEDKEEEDADEGRVVVEVPSEFIPDEEQTLGSDGSTADSTDETTAEEQADETEESEEDIEDFVTPDQQQGQDSAFPEETEPVEEFDERQRDSQDGDVASGGLDVSPGSDFDFGSGQQQGSDARPFVGAIDDEDVAADAGDTTADAGSDAGPAEAQPPDQTPQQASAPIEIQLSTPGLTSILDPTADGTAETPQTAEPTSGSPTTTDTPGTTSSSPPRRLPRLAAFGAGGDLPSPDDAPADTADGDSPNGLAAGWLNETVVAIATQAGGTAQSLEDEVQAERTEGTAAVLGEFAAFEQVRGDAETQEQIEDVQALLSGGTTGSDGDNTQSDGTGDFEDFLEVGGGENGGGLL